MKTALILVNAYTDLKAISSQAVRLQVELEKRGVHAEIRRNGDLSIWITEQGDYAIAPHSYDFCVYLDKDKYTSALLEQSGLRLFNSHRGIQICDDKMETAIHLANHGIPMPKTIPAPLCYYPGIAPNEDFLDYVANSLGLPLVIKESYGSLGGQVYLAKTRQELTQISSQLQGKHHIYQEFVAESAGFDIRVIVIGGKVAGAIKRVSATDFRSNIELGGHGEIIDLPEAAAALSEKAAACLGLDYCGVDVLCRKDGYAICEVNSNAFFEGVEAVTGQNIAGCYADHIINTVYS
jgi:ribosomal protein S6--L-glutamate ligase/gamma-F420-2:alpha-L-glutamate ligase